MKKEKRFKPKDKERYYFATFYSVVEDFWQGFECDKRRYKYHNCFRTKAEAQKKLSEIKTLLKS